MSRTKAYYFVLIMRVFIILIAFAVARAGVVKKCSLVDIRGVNHEKTVLKSGIDAPYQLAIDYDTSYLFFSYSNPDGRVNQFKSAYINLKTNEFGIIKNIPDGFANTVDAHKHDVYLGGDSGIYKFDFDTKTASSVGAADFKIWQLYSKDKLYFTDYPSERAYIFENGVVKRVPELNGKSVTLMALDDNDNIFFSNSDGLFCYKKDKSRIVKLGAYDVNGFTNDIDKHVFFSTPSGIYAIDTNAEDVLKLADIDEFVYGIAIDSDHSIIYADGDSIIRLKQTDKKC